MLKKKFFKTKDEVEITFVFDANGAKSVELVTEINGWEPIEMAKSKGAFRTKLRAPKGGEYQFRYRVDGAEWQNDEAADAYVPNGIDGDNSIVKTHA
jgi:1,4-alpha-glucan branching enzyme